MKLKIALISFILVTFSIFANAQTADSEFVQFILTNVETPKKIVEIDNFMRNQSGIEISRSDLLSKKYFCIYNPSGGINEESFNTWMKKLGVKYICYRQGKYGIDKVIDQKMDCE